MKGMLSLRIAWRYLKSKKAHNAVNVISIISTCGVAIATAALICVLSVFNGFHGLIQGRLAKLDPQLQITPAQGKAINDADSVIYAVQQADAVQQAMPVVQDQALAIFAGYQMPVVLKGVPPDYEDMVSVDSVMVAGKFMLRDAVSRYAVAGVGPAMQLHLAPESLRMLQLYAPQRQGRVNLANPLTAFRNDSAFVAGVFQLQQNSYDASLIFVPIDLARELFDYDTQATSIELKLMPGANVESTRKALQAMLGTSYVVKDRLMQQAESFKLVNVEKWMSFLLLAFIMVIATFNIISTLSLLIIEKDDSIRTMRNLGATDGQITSVFVTEGWLISLAGAAAGIALGLVLCVCQQHFGWLKLQGNPDLMVVRAYPVEVVWTDLLVVAALVVAIAAATSAITALTMRHRLK